MSYQENANPFMLSASIPSVYSGAHRFCSVPIVSEITLTDICRNMQDSRARICELIVRIYGSYKGREFLKQEIKISRFRLSDYLRPGTNTAVFDLSDKKILPDNDFFTEISEPIKASIALSVTIGDKAFSRVFAVRMLPFGYLSTEMPPELSAIYIFPGCRLADRARTECGTDGAARLTGNISAIKTRAEKIAMVMKSYGFTYSPLASELSSGECSIRDYDSFAFSNNKSLSLTEATLMYCSLAEGVGLCPVPIFLKKADNATKALVGIRTSLGKSAVCESITELREAVASGDLLIFDISRLLGTEELDFRKSLSETASFFFTTNASLVFAMDTVYARALGVRSLHPLYDKYKNTEKKKYGNASDAVLSVIESVSNICLRGFSPYTSRALGICAKANSLEFGREYNLCAIDEEVLCSDPDSFGYISTFSLHSFGEHPRNMTEQALYDTKIKGLLSEIEKRRSLGSLSLYSSSLFLSGKKLTCSMIRDNVSYDLERLYEAQRNKLFSKKHLEVYAATGSVTFTKDGKQIIAPCAYVPCTLSINSDSGEARLIYGTDRAVINLALVDETEAVLGRPEELSGAVFGGRSYRQAELSGILTHYARLSNYDSEYTYHPDSFIYAFDLSPIYMRSCIEGTDGGCFEEYILSGKYVSDSQDTSLEDFNAEISVKNLPFELCEEFRLGVECAARDSVLLKGPVGCGKMTAAASIAIGGCIIGQDTLIVSKHSETLDSFVRTFDTVGLSEMCLVVGNGKEMRDQIISDIDLITTPLDEYEAEEPDYELAALEEQLSNYGSELHQTRSFGMSLFQCIDEYCVCCESTSESPVEADFEVAGLTVEGKENLMRLADELCDNARELWASLCTSTLENLKIDRIGITDSVGENTHRDLCDASARLREFAKNSEAARLVLGIEDSILCDIRSLRAFGDFLESVIFSGVDFMPEGLLVKGVYGNSKKIEEICGIIENIRELTPRISDVSQEIFENSVRNLYARWQMGENNPFVRGSVSREVKKHLPVTVKLNAAQIGELLSDLAKYEGLTESYDGKKSECEKILGSLWKGLETDTETARRAARFAILSDSCSGKMFGTEKKFSGLREGITSLIGMLKSESEARSELLLSVGAFRKLIGNGISQGLLDSISRSLSVDLYDIKFENGILSENGLSGYLTALSENKAVLSLLPKYNDTKKRASLLGILPFVSYAEKNGGTDECKVLFRKSIFARIISKITKETSVLSETGFEDYKNYVSLYKARKKGCALSLRASHRENFATFTSTPGGKEALITLKRELADTSLTNLEIYTRNSEILSVMYRVVLASLRDAYRLYSHPSMLILADCDKTDAAEALPICALFDKCIFLSGPSSMQDSVAEFLPKGIPEFSQSHVLSEKNPHYAELLSSVGADISYTRKAQGTNVLFVKCESGMYDRDARINRIEALCACETALGICKAEGFANVGIIAATAPQASEITKTLEVLSRKHGNSEIAKIPVRYIGSMGVFSKDNIVFSLTFGKNVYSVTRSFGAFDSAGGKADRSLPGCMLELLNSCKKLYTVSSVEPGDIMTDCKDKGAGLVSTLLSFAKYGAIKRPLADAEAPIPPGIRRYIARLLCEKDLTIPVTYTGIVRTDNLAFIFDDGSEAPLYDKIVLPLTELTSCGCKTDFILPTDIPEFEQQKQE